MKVATKIRETCEKIKFTPASPRKATNSIISVQAIRGRQNCQRMFSDRLSQNCQRAFSDKTQPNHQRLLSDSELPNCHRLLSNKRAPDCRIYLVIISSKLPGIMQQHKNTKWQQSFSDAGDVMLTSSSQNKGIRVTYHTPPTKDLLKNQTMALIAMMRG